VRKSGRRPKPDIAPSCRKRTSRRSEKGGGPRLFTKSRGKGIRANRKPKLMNDHFVCSICGETHSGLTTDWAYNLPDEVWALSEPEKAARTKYDSDLCKLDDRHFIRCILAHSALRHGSVAKRINSGRTLDL
jgi:hypothetical protein